MRTKKGFWVKHGKLGSKGYAPGSYGGYIYERAAPSAYPKTAQQKKIGACAREHVKKGMALRDIQEAMRKCAGK